MDMVIHGLNFSFVYIDDILVASKDKSQHKQHLRAVFECLCEYGLLINASKCNLGSSQVQYLGYEITREGTWHASGSRIAVPTAAGHFGAPQVFGHREFLSPVH